MRRTVTTMALVLMMVGALAVPAGAADLGDPPVGTQIPLLTPPGDTFTADQPFHIKQGWEEDLSEPFPWLRAGFRLYVDGSFDVADGLQVTEDSGVLSVYRVHNFDSGLPAGEHTFLGQWTLPCQYALDNGYRTTDCGSRWWQRARPVVVFSANYTITFE